MKKIYHILSIIFLFVASTVTAQKNLTPDSPKYEQLKKEGKLKQSMIRKGDTNGLVITPNVQRNISGVNQMSSVHALCSCMIPLDTSFQIVPFTNGTGPEYRNDDGSSPLINLPFSFCLYGVTYNSVYINNNGNISFQQPWSLLFGPMWIPG
jgi:hypothetical protein